jgi:pilus assembly protein CpaF
MTTAHANSAREAFSRLETMVMMASQHIPDNVIRQMLASAVNLVIHCTRLIDGTRKVTSITEVVDIVDEKVVMEDIFVFDREGVNERGKAIGKFRATGYKPACLTRLKAYGIHLSPAIFQEEMALRG